MEVNQITKITLAWELFESGVPKAHIASQLQVGRETIHIWLGNIKRFGLLDFLEQYSQAKKGSRVKRKADGLLKSRVFKLREENRDCCGQKIRQFLFDEYGIRLSVTSIYKILGEKYQLRSKWKKNQKRGSVPKADRPREVIQMDTVDFGQIYAFTAVDICSREVVVKLYQSLTASDGLDFLKYSFSSKYKHTDLLQTDGGSEFKAQFRSNVFNYANRFRISRPYRKNEQSYIESFNRSLRKECLGWGKFQPKDIPSLEKELTDYLMYYHSKRPHLSLGLKTPNQFLEEVSDI